MKTFLAALGLLTSVHLALADVNYSIAKDQAKRQAGQNPPSPGAPAGPPSAPPTDPALAATLRNISSLQADIAALNQSAAAKPDSDLKVALLNDLMAAAQGTRPAAAAVQKLGGHLATALNGRKLPLPAQQKLARSLHALFNGAHLAAPQQENMLDGVKKILTDAGVTAEDADNLVTELKAVAAATQ